MVTLGAPAEYGNVQGAVFNVVTRQGSNQFHGDANFYFQDQELTGRNTTDEEDGGLPYHRDSYHDLTLQLGGPVVKDRLWFFASYQYQRDRASRAGTDSRYPEQFEEDRIFFKLNWQIGERTRLMLAYHDDFYRLSEPAAANVAPSTLSVGHGHDPTPNLTFTRSFSEKTRARSPLLGVLWAGRRRSPRSEGRPGPHASATWTLARSAEAAGTGMRETSGEPPCRASCRISPTISWGPATTSSSAFSTTGEAGNPSRATTTTSTPTRATGRPTATARPACPSTTARRCDRSASMSMTPFAWDPD